MIDPRWTLIPGLLRDNGVRGELCLNAFWAVDGCGGRPAEAWQRVPAVGDRQAVVSLHREVDLPAGWEGRDLDLDLGDALDAVPNYFNGRSQAVLPPPEVSVDGVAVPAGRGPLPPGGGRRRIAWRGGLIAGDSYLRSRRPSPQRIDASYLWAEVAGGRLRLRADGAGRPATVRLLVAGDAAMTTILLDHRFTPAEAGAGWTLEATIPLADLPRWSPWEPRLVWYVLELLDHDGRADDRLLPRRTGLREIAIRDGRVHLNGIPLWCAGDVWEHAGSGSLHREQTRTLLRHLKGLGLGFGFGNASPLVYDLADEEGFLLFPNLGGLERFNVWDPGSGLLDMGGSATAAGIARTVRALREHPSLVFWQANSPFDISTLHAGWVGRNQAPWNWFPLNRDRAQSRIAHLRLRDLQALVAEHDPARELAPAMSPFSPIELCTRYVDDNLDVQERAEFFEDWFRNQPQRALWPVEFGVPFQGHNFIRRTSFQHPHHERYPSLVYENAARLFGDGVYGEEPDAVLRQWPLMDLTAHSQGPVFQRAVAEQVRDILRAWRSHGVCPRGHVSLNREGTTYAPGRDCAAAFPPGDPRQSGLSQAKSLIDFPWPGIDRLTRVGLTYAACYQPVTGHLGGGRGAVTDRSHIWYAGSAVEKALVVLNDSGRPIAVAGSWRLLTADGGIHACGRIAGEVPPGDRTLDRFPIRLVCPMVDVRSELTLEVAAEAGGCAIADRLAITVFPPRQVRSWPSGRQVWRLNLSDDRVHERRHFTWNRVNEELLAATGVPTRLVAGLRAFAWKGVGPEAVKDLDRGRTLVEEGSPAPGDLLIIPRHCLRAGTDHSDLNLRLLDRLGLDQLIEAGLRVLVLEQDLPNVFGLATQETRTRRAFVSAPGHPVFAGLTDGDLCHWTGDSDLAVAQTPCSPSLDELPDQLWHHSNRNSVATRVYIRPQVGAARALAVSGFDLMESPLLEVCRGRGRILFCGFDVSNRYGSDPVATTLLDNCLDYLLSAPEPDPGRQAIHPAAPATTVRRSQVFRAARPAGADGWGITAGELFFRDALYTGNLPTAALPELPLDVFADSADPARPEVVRRAGDGFQLTLTEADLPSAWMRRKLAWIRAALTVNAGASSAAGPALALHGNRLALYPIAWSEGFVHPYTAELW